MSKKIFKGIGKVALGPIGMLVGKKLLGGGKKKAAPAPEPVMPIADDQSVLLARKRSIAEQRKRGGRASTILTDNEPLGN